MAYHPQVDWWRTALMGWQPMEHFATTVVAAAARNTKKRKTFHFWRINLHLKSISTTTSMTLKSLLTDDEIMQNRSLVRMFVESNGFTLPNRHRHRTDEMNLFQHSIGSHLKANNKNENNNNNKRHHRHPKQRRFRKLNPSRILRQNQVDVYLIPKNGC